MENYTGEIITSAIRDTQSNSLLHVPTTQEIQTILAPTRTKTAIITQGTNNDTGIILINGVGCSINNTDILRELSYVLTMLGIPVVSINFDESDVWDKKVGLKERTDFTIDCLSKLTATTYATKWILAGHSAGGLTGNLASQSFNPNIPVICINTPMPDTSTLEAAMNAIDIILTNKIRRNKQTQFKNGITTSTAQTNNMICFADKRDCVMQPEQWGNRLLYYHDEGDPNDYRTKEQWLDIHNISNPNLRQTLLRMILQQILK